MCNVQPEDRNLPWKVFEHGVMGSAHIFSCSHGEHYSIEQSMQRFCYAQQYPNELQLASLVGNTEQAYIFSPVIHSYY
jgi:hypothetical protein